MYPSNKYKIGDRIRLLVDFGVKGAIKGKTYTIIDILQRTTSKLYLLSIPEGKSHAHYDGTNPGWWFEGNRIELLKGQMLFSFMYKD